MSEIERQEPSPNDELQKKKEELDPNSVQYRVLCHLENGEKIQAIKLIREETHVGLAEAKEAAEQIAREYGLQSQTGCLVLLCLFGLGLLAGLMV